jgi:hypothetical protein
VTQEELFGPIWILWRSQLPGEALEDPTTIEDQPSLMAEEE